MTDDKTFEDKVLEEWFVWIRSTGEVSSGVNKEYLFSIIKEGISSWKLSYDAYLARAKKDKAEIDRLKKFEAIARCSYQHTNYLIQRGFCQKCGWFQTMGEEVRMK